MLNIALTEMPSAEAATLRRKVLQRFAPEGVERRFAWEYLQDKVSFQDAEAWRWLGEYIGHTPAVLFFDDHDEATVFRFEDGHDIVTIIAECFAFEFYVTNPAVEYLLCFNHHDYLIAAGAAKKWLEKRISVEAGTQH